NLEIHQSKETRLMLNQLFKYPRVLNRYLTSPLLDMRLVYLRHCAEQGFSQISLQLIAYYQLIITDYLNLQTAHTITPSEIEAAADRWAQHPVIYRRANVGSLPHLSWFTIPAL